MHSRGREDDQTTNVYEECKPKCRPDSLWSWLVCAASALSVVIVAGISYSFGLLLPPLMENFDETRQATGIFNANKTQNVAKKKTELIL